MRISLSRSLNVRRAEQPRLAWLYGMLFVSVLGCVWGEAVIEAGFLREVGVQYLPLAIACSALLSMGSITVYNLFADRIANHALLVCILALSLLGIGTGILLLGEGWIALAFPLLYVVDAVLVRDMLNMHWPIYVNGFFDTQSAKRVFPVVSSASRLAAIAGGVTMPLLNRAISVTAIVAVMLFTQFVMLALTFLMRRALGDRLATSGVRPDSGHSRKDGRATARANIREGYRYVTGSRYLRWIAAATLLTMVLLAYLNYESGRLLLADLKTVRAISNFTALLRGLGNLVALPIQLFLLSRIIGRIGVGNANLIFPSTSLVAVGGLTLAPGLFTAGLAYLTRTVIRNTFFLPVDGLLYNAVPLRIKARARGFISGYVMTAGSLIGGLLLMFNARMAGPFLAVLFGGLAFAYVASAWQVRRHYGKAVVAMLEQDDFLSLQAPSDAELSVVDDTTLDRLAARMTAPDASTDVKAFTAQVLCQVGGERAAPVLAAAIRDTPDGHLRARLVEALATSRSKAAEAEAIYTTCLTDRDKEVRRAALAGLEECTGDDQTRFQALCSPLLADPDLEVRAAALGALVRNGGLCGQRDASQVLESLLDSGAAETRALGVSMLGRLLAGPGRFADPFVSRLLAALNDGDDTVRLAAVLALEEAAGPVGALLPAWLPTGAVAKLLEDHVERVRLAGAGLLARSPLPEAQALLAGALGDPSPIVRTAAGQGLMQAGQATVPLLRPLLDSPASRRRTMAAAVLGRIDPGEFGPVILSPCITGDLQAAYRCRAYLATLECAPSSPHAVDRRQAGGIAVLQRALEEQNARRIDDIFYLLAAIRPAETVNKIATSLHGRDQLSRANALEALEVLTTPQIARLLGPLCEEPPNTKRILAIAGATWDRTAPDFEATVRELVEAPGDPWLSELAAIAGGLASLPGRQEENVLSPIERVIFLKEAPFFQGMTVEQLRVLANVCEEEFFPAGAALFKEGDPGGTLYVVVSGRVAIEQEKRPGSVARLATVEAHSYLGEADFFDSNCRTNSASAIQDTLTLKLRREPLIALARQYPDLSLELIKVLSERLREANNRIAELTRAHPQKLHKLYDQLG